MRTLSADLRPDASAGFEALVVTGAAWALCAAAAWASTVTAVVALEAARAVPAASRGVPAPVRLALLRACGAALAGSLVAGATAPALATGSAAGRDARSAVPAPPAGPVSPGDRVTTRPGDSLWRVAEAELRAATGREPSDAEVAAYWPRIHAANRVLIGPDPDFVLPGVPLALPAPTLEKEQP